MILRKAIYATPAILLVLLCLFILFMFQNQKKLNQSEDIRYQSYLLADELRQSSDDLTRLARTYVITGDAKYEQMYWDVLAIRNGEKPRPRDYGRIYWDLVLKAGDKPRPDDQAVALNKLMEQLGFTREEFAKLKEAQDNSDGLVKTETIAMNAMKGLFEDGQGKFTRKGKPDSELARRIMHDNQYHANKALIMKPVNDFFEMLDSRTLTQVNTLVQRGNLYLRTILLLAVLLAVSIAISVFVARRSIAAAVTRVAEKLTHCSQGVNDASGQMHQGSQTLSEMVSSQAAALEETTSAITEIYSITQQNAGNAKEANTLMNETGKVVGEVNASMTELIGAIQEITVASEQMSKIIRTIDEIAFQTNLLALNAAVEAARAGDAGKGFAVVAEEVRNLAKRAAEAAKNTTALIGTTVEKIGHGAQIATHTNASFGKVAQGAQQAGNLVQEIAQSSAQQAQGIAQINKALTEMDQAVQGSAATAEESTAASQELKLRAEQMAEFVGELVLTVGGGRRNSAGPC